VALSVLGGILMTGGCGSDKKTAVLRLPDAPRLVGGGILIAWKAPERGTVYLVERQTGKIVETRTVEEGELYSFAATSVVQADEFEQMLGIRFGKAHFLLYFEPGGEGPADEPGETVRVWSRS
jgi:hypothetical protein